MQREIVLNFLKLVDVNVAGQFNLNPALSRLLESHENQTMRHIEIVFVLPLCSGRTTTIGDSAASSS